MVCVFSAVLTLAGALRPLLRAVPGALARYPSAAERASHDEASARAKRYRRQAEELNARETASRWQGVALNDDEVRRVSSFLKSYNEMLKGE